MDVTKWLISKNQFEPKDERVNLANRSTKAQTVCFLSGKGGVGKTTCALKFAQNLKENNLKVLVIDCDFNLSNTGIKLNISHSKTLLDYKAGHDLNEYIFKGWDCDMIFSGNGALSYFEHDERDYLELIISSVQKLESQYDFIVLDLPAGCSRTTLSLSSYCDHRMLVVTPDKSSLTDSYSMIKLLNKIYGISSNHLILNKIQYKYQLNKISESLISTAEKFLNVDLNFLGYLNYIQAPLDKMDENVFHRKNGTVQKNMQRIFERFSDELKALHGEQVFQAYSSYDATGCQQISQGV